MRILITGGKGQLGRELERKLSRSHDVWSLGKEELDITRKDEVDSVLTAIRPEMIIHCAAYTAVDECEKNRKKAFEVNGLGTCFLVQAASRLDARIIYISTDYVFDGAKGSPYTEDDEPNPLSIYGLSKWMGEKFVLNYMKGTVVRTSWLYGHSGKNFVKTMLRLAESKKEIKVVHDQIGSPTYAKDLVQVIVQLFGKKDGIYHVSNKGQCTWYEFAKEILRLAQLDPAIISPITTEEYNAPAPRPKYSVLGHEGLKREEILPLRPWDEALEEFFRKEKTFYD